MAYLPLLIGQLQQESALYTKIEICTCLAEWGEPAIGWLIPLLGRIGRNQHHVPQNIDLGKKSYPLPRDIVARILSKMGPVSLPYLQDVLHTDNAWAIYEAVDAIGYIAWHHHDNALEQAILHLLSARTQDPLMVWKCLRCLQAFSTQAVQKCLQTVLADTHAPLVLRNEAQRSLERIRTRAQTESSASRPMMREAPEKR